MLCASLWLKKQMKKNFKKQKSQQQQKKSFSFEKLFFKFSSSLNPLAKKNEAASFFVFYPFYFWTISTFCFFFFLLLLISVWGDSKLFPFFYNDSKLFPFLFMKKIKRSLWDWDWFTRSWWSQRSWGKKNEMHIQYCVLVIPIETFSILDLYHWIKYQFNIYTPVYILYIDYIFLFWGGEDLHWSFYI